MIKFINVSILCCCFFIQKADTKCNDKAIFTDLILAFKVNYDSVIVDYWNSYNATNYIYKYTNDTIKIHNWYLGYNGIIVNDSIIDSFLYFSYNVYILDSITLKSQEEVISVDSQKNQLVIVADYPEIYIKVYLKGKEVFRKRTIVDDQTEFTPLFLKFYKFISREILPKLN